MEIKTLSGTRTINFPQSPPDGYQYSEHGRVWEWMAGPRHLAVCVQRGA